ncbi:ketosynthase chain-length factor [Micromonospora aurantiaca (nom. illeg.)]
MSTAVVTGLGVVAPNGVGAGDYWAATLRGRSAIGRIDLFDVENYPSRLGGVVTGFDAGNHLPSRLLPQTDRMTRFALAAADWAVADADIDRSALAATDLGVSTASASGGFAFGQKELEHLCADGPSHVSVYQSFAWFYAVNSGQISIRHDMRGPIGVLVADQAGGLDAIAHARRSVRKGAPLVLTGGMDSALSPYGLAALISSGMLSTADDPRHAYLPFDRKANGHVPGEGGAILTVEDGDRARERGAHVYGEIAGYAATFDPSPGSGRPGNLGRAVRAALADAGVGPDEVGVVFADAAGDADADRAEAEVIVDLFGPRGVPVTAPKTMTGRLYSGAGPLDVATALLSLRDKVIPPTVNVVADYALDLVEAPRPLTASVALVLARGRQGFNSALVVRAPRKES